MHHMPGGGYGYPGGMGALGPWGGPRFDPYMSQYMDPYEYAERMHDMMEMEQGIPVQYNQYIMMMGDAHRRRSRWWPGSRRYGGGGFGGSFQNGPSYGRVCLF